MRPLGEQVVFLRACHCRIFTRPCLVKESRQNDTPGNVVIRDMWKFFLTDTESFISKQR